MGTRLLVLQGMGFQALPYAMSHASQSGTGKRRQKLALISAQHLGSLEMMCALHTEEKSCNRKERHRWSEVTRLRDGMPKIVMRVQPVPDYFNLRKGGKRACLDLQTSKTSDVNRVSTSV